MHEYAEKSMHEYTGDERVCKSMQEKNERVCKSVQEKNERVCNRRQ